MIVIEVYNTRQLLLDVVNNSTNPGAISNLEIDWEKLGGVASSTLEVSPNFLFNIAVDTELKIYWSDDAQIITDKDNFLKHIATTYVTKVPEFKSNETVKIASSGYWEKLNNLCQTATYTNTETGDEVHGYESDTIQNIILDLFDRNIVVSYVISSPSGIIQLDEPAAYGEIIKITVPVTFDGGGSPVNIPSTTNLAFQDGAVAQNQIGTELLAGSTYKVQYVDAGGGNFNLNYISEADAPITDRISQSIAKINAPADLVTNFVLEDTTFTDAMSTLVDMANKDYKNTQYVCYVNKDKELVFEQLSVQAYLHEGYDFHNPDVSEEEPTINRVNFYTKNAQDSAQTVFRGFLQNADSISKYGVKSKSLVFTLEEGENTELSFDDENAVVYMARMLIAKNAFPQNQINIRRIQSFLEQGLYSITTQPSLGQKTVMEGDSLIYPETNDNIPGQWNMSAMTNTGFKSTTERYLFGKASIEFTLSSFSTIDQARYNFPNAAYSIQSFSVWVRCEGGASADIILPSILDEVRKTVTIQDTWVKVIIEPAGNSQAAIKFIGVSGDIIESTPIYQSTELPVTEETMYQQTETIEELYNYGVTAAIPSGGLLGIKESAADEVVPLTLFAKEGNNGAFVFTADHFLVEFNNGAGAVYIDRAEITSKTNLTAIESLERQRIKIDSAAFENRISLGERPSSLIDEVEKGTKEGDSAYEMYKGAAKSFAP